MPKHHEWKKFAEWAKEYGDCVCVHVLGRPIVILHSLEAAHELLDRRSAIYSSRPHLVMAGDLVGFNRSMGLMPYSARFVSLRRLMHKELTGNELRKYWPLHEEESRLLVDAVLLNPASFLESIRHYAGSMILRVLYGYQTLHQDPFLELAERVMSAFSQSAQPGTWLVDTIPWLRQLPAWLPGMQFKRTAAAWRKLDEAGTQGPFKWALAHKDSPELVQPNFVSTMMAKSSDELSNKDLELLMYAAGSLFGGGADTTVSALATFFLAMALYPEVQKEAQAEIDRVLGDGGVPHLSDRPSLPYVECLMWELLRWKPLAPLGLPHLLTKDDIYSGYHLPSGSVVMVNVWSILQDPDMFPDPNEFRPSRFLNNNKALETVASIFGFGRRSCPGIHFAQSSMFIAIATVLAQCNISEPVNMRGERISNDVEYLTGTISHPDEFRCNIQPRTKISSN
ncbi:cytochrome P450 [Mycena filopes]|nr:cytochrome P450 [Mycena filopes]